MPDDYVIVDENGDQSEAVCISLTPKKIERISEALKIENNDYRLTKIVFLTEYLMGAVWEDFLKSSETATEEYIRVKMARIKDHWTKYLMNTTKSMMRTGLVFGIR